MASQISLNAPLVGCAEDTPTSSPSRDAQYRKKEKEKGKGGRERGGGGKRACLLAQVAHSPMI